MPSRNDHIKIGTAASASCCETENVKTDNGQKDTDCQNLANWISGSLRSVTQEWLFLPLVQLLARGEPVTIEHLAMTTSRAVSEIREALAACPDTEFDDQGRIVGYGLTLRTTMHRFKIGGRFLYTWCALDTLIFPTMIGCAARIESPCHSTGVLVCVDVEPAGALRVEPATAVVSIVTPEAPASVRGEFCNHVHFFINADSALQWLDGHPGAIVVPVSDAYQIGRQLLDTALWGGACC